MVQNRTINYRFSAKTKDDVSVVDLKKVIALHNEEQRDQASLGIGIDPHFLKVRLRGRGTRTDANGNSTGRDTPHALATYFDVYVVRDTDAMNKYNLAKATAAVKTTAKTLSSRIKQAALSLTAPVGVAS